MELDFKNQNGFSLLQVLISISILAVIVGLGAPSMSAMMNRTTIAATQERLLQDIRLIKSAAKTWNQQAYLCSSADGVTCSAANQWPQGWLGYIDVDNNGDYDGQGVDALIAAYRPGKALNITVSLNLGGGLKAVKIASDGVIKTSGNFRICDPDADLAQIETITMNNQGRIAKQRRPLACR